MAKSFQLNLNPKSVLKELHFQEICVNKMMVINMSDTHLHVQIINPLTFETK